MTRIVIKNGDVELPEAELVTDVHGFWHTKFDNEAFAAAHSWLKSDWPDSYIVEPKRELPPIMPEIPRPSGGQLITEWLTAYQTTWNQWVHDFNEWAQKVVDE